MSEDELIDPLLAGSDDDELDDPDVLAEAFDGDDADDDIAADAE